VTVSPGDTIIGYTKLYATSGSTLDWKVLIQDQNIGINSWNLIESTGLQWNWAYAAVLEAYDVTSCSQFPKGSKGTEVFQNSKVDHGYPYYELISPQRWAKQMFQWTGPSCGFNVVPGTKSTLYF